MTATITPATLRAFAAQLTHLANELDAAREIADGAARSDIETMCTTFADHGHAPRTPEEFRNCWYDTGRLPEPEHEATVRTALRYLSGRGLLQQHPEKRTWVRPVNSKEGSQT